MKQFLSKEQAQILIDMGVNLDGLRMHYADFCIYYRNVSNEYKEEYCTQLRYGHTGDIRSDVTDDYLVQDDVVIIIPTLSIGELIERLPIMFDPSEGRYHSVPHERVIAQNAVMYMCPNNSYGYSTIYKFADCDELINNLFDCYVQLIKDGVIKL